MYNDYLFVTTSSSGRIENSVMKMFFESVRSMSGVCQVEFLEAERLYPNSNSRAAIKKSRVVLVHSPLVSILPIAIVSRFLGAEVWAFVWDVYPVVIDGKRFDNRITRRLADIAENIALKLCNRVFVPTSDFLKEPRLVNANVLNLWPRSGEEECRLTKRTKSSDTLRILFAGQVNATRGITEALKLLTLKTNGDFQLLIASQNALPEEIAQHPNVVAIGYNSKSDLRKYSASIDFGLVSLAKGLEGPGFPSKTLDYVAMGLPIIYSGPSMKAYLNILYSTDIGVDLQRIEHVDSELASNLRLDYARKRDQFMDMVCINGNEIERIFAL